jgi:hypothetical protein
MKFAELKLYLIWLEEKNESNTSDSKRGQTRLGLKKVAQV